MDIAGFYHSHPSAEAYPSERDRLHPYWLPHTAKPSDAAGGPDLWIVSLLRPEDPDVGVFRRTARGLQQLVLTEVSIQLSQCPNVACPDSLQIEKP